MRRTKSGGRSSGEYQEISQGIGKEFRRQPRKPQQPPPDSLAIAIQQSHQVNDQETIMAISAINVRNQFKGTVKEIIRGSVVSEVDVETPYGIVTSVITTRSIDELDLKVGAEVVALVKSTEVSIARL